MNKLVNLLKSWVEFDLYFNNIFLMSNIQDELDNNDYISNILNPILEPLVLEIFLKKPTQ